MVLKRPPNRTCASEKNKVKNKKQISNEDTMVSISNFQIHRIRAERSIKINYPFFFSHFRINIFLLEKSKRASSAGVCGRRISQRKRIHRRERVLALPKSPLQCSIDHSFWETEEDKSRTHMRCDGVQKSKPKNTEQL